MVSFGIHWSPIDSIPNYHLQALQQAENQILNLQSSRMLKYKALQDARINQGGNILPAELNSE